MSATSTLKIRLLDRQSAEAAAAAPETLALIRHGGPTKAVGQPPSIDTALPLVEGSALEQWRVGSPVSRRRLGAFSLSCAEDLAFAVAVFPDSDDLCPVVDSAYRELYATAAESGYPYVLRTWHYFPRIYDRLGEENRYQRFCMGRRRALDALALDSVELPAASLLGDAAPGLLLYALLSVERGYQIENPRQVSAFRYPPRYGRARPAFSRAVLRHANAGCELFISGTASITGHASRHATVTEQAREILHNLEVLLKTAGKTGGANSCGLETIAPLKVYLRSADDLPSVKAELQAHFPARHPIVFLRADVCRRELLVEFEGVAMSR